ncbi:MAG: hypothetical protein Q7S72_00450 [Candidatus Taylorbacteria bacterium]|nr:hypothetical protein [Candidatus Taylorbacteria bacterium]
MSEIFKNSPTFRLFKKEPSLVDGVASLRDHSSNLDRYNQDKTENEADTNSLRADWYAVGNDLWKTMQKYDAEQKSTA